MLHGWPARSSACRAVAGPVQAPWVLLLPAVWRGKEPLGFVVFPLSPQELVDKTQQFVEGTVRVKLYKASARIRKLALLGS